ncbi:flagellar hook-length control protein FliK [Halomonas elongata]|uniref:flagellar hook-length control protein FliK n=1 Tax=Halomonas elongata TaxID=2746 RepID=UPI002E2A47D6|nr:flagellar hook-length control protein FliK [Halomonas elongata]WVI71574.1 flagellar hook-length control protein FliK [Halomonas elongata]
MEILPRLIGALGKAASPDTAPGSAGGTDNAVRDTFRDAMAALSSSPGGREAPQQALDATGDTASDVTALVQETNGWPQWAEEATLTPLEPTAISRDPAPSEDGDTSSPALAATMERLLLIERAGTQAATQAAPQAEPGLRATVAGAAMSPSQAGGARQAMPQANLPSAGMSRQAMPQDATAATATRPDEAAFDTAMARQARDTDPQRPAAASRELPSPQAPEQRSSPGAAAGASAPATTPREPAAATAFVPTQGDADAAAPRLDTAVSTHAAAQHTGSSGQAAPGVNASTPLAQASLSAPVGSQEWSQQLGRQLLRFSQGSGEQRIEMRLHPAELGPLSVSLKVGDQGAHAQFLSAHAPVRQALEQAIPQLREALAEQGITLGETSVGEQHQGGANDTGGGFAGGGTNPAGSGDDEPAGGELTPDRRVAMGMSPDGRVDLYA